MMMLTLALLVSGLLQAPGATSEQDAVRTALERLETEWNAAHVRGDAAALDRIFSDDIVVIVRVPRDGCYVGSGTSAGAFRNDTTPGISQFPHISSTLAWK